MHEGGADGKLQSPPGGLAGSSTAAITNAVSAFDALGRTPNGLSCHPDPKNWASLLAVQALESLGAWASCQLTPSNCLFSG